MSTAKAEDVGRARMDCTALPQAVMGYVVRFTGRHQIVLALLSVCVFLLSTMPLELQRRIVNDAIKAGMTETVLWSALVYAGVALGAQVLKLILNLYRAWLSERSIRALRRRIYSLSPSTSPERNPPATTGTQISMILDEAVPIGGFVGISVSEPLLQGGIMVSVIGYMVYLETYMALLSLLFLVPQFVFVPLMQRAINHRAEMRIRTLREVSSAIVAETSLPAIVKEEDERRIEHIFTLNMGIYKLKYSMHLLMHVMHHLAVAAALGVGGWFATTGRVDVGTVVAVVSGLGKLKDPWDDIVNWSREFSAVSVKYRLFVEAARRLAAVTPIGKTT
ncbi:ABC transporter ATP-binding protein [Vineibacter terrae]|uniref:ABC transporter ATP-binding protein n=1 Tax=Vineibacter terrae TaxID=2586908 RepID=A0A5C8PGN2_9HYPH|nr:ABC transporter transmembrane domain-containing protein [Vineibacter terrae]TXL72677.1 ABC transporter ATP-binding protein [Vineibacter terrae]